MLHNVIKHLKVSNAAGTCKTVEDVRKLASSAVTEILVGSATVEARTGNPGTNHYQDEKGGSINSLGLPNPGKDYYAEHLPEMASIAHQAEKKLGFSIAPFSEDDTFRLGELANIAEVDCLELNAGCPNLWVEGKQKKILSFNPAGLETHLNILIELKMASRHPLTLRVKLSPYSDPVLLQEIAALIGSFGTKKRAHIRIEIVTANTYPNAYMLKYENGIWQPAIPFGEHVGGFSGDPYRSIVLGQVAQFRNLLPKHPVIGVGGISRGQHAWEYLCFDVKGIQIGSAYYYTENPKIFSDVLEELFFCSELPKGI